MLLVGIGAARAHGGRAPDGESRVRRDQRAHHAHVDVGAALQAVGSRRAGGAAGRRAAAGAARRRARERDLLRAPRGRLRPAVRHRRPAADRRPVPRRRRVADGVAWLLRGVQDPGAARPHVQRTRHGAVAAGRRSSTRRWRGSSGRRATRSPTGSPSAGASCASSRRKRERQIVGVVADVRDGGLNNDPQPTMYIPQAQVPDAANALNVGITPMAWMVRTRRQPVHARRPGPRGAPAGHRAPDLGDPHDGPGDRAIDVAAALQHVADDRVRRLRAAARRHRHLRADRLLGRAAQPGDRHPPRPRRQPGPGAADGRHAGDEARGRGARASASRSPSPPRASSPACSSG